MMLLLVAVQVGLVGSRGRRQRWAAEGRQETGARWGLGGSLDLPLQYWGCHWTYLLPTIGVTGLNSIIPLVSLD